MNFFGDQHKKNWEKKKGGLSKIKGPNGKIETERDKVANLAITELEKGFSWTKKF